MCKIIALYNFVWNPFNFCTYTHVHHNLKITKLRYILFNKMRPDDLAQLNIYGRMILNVHILALTSVWQCSFWRYCYHFLICIHLPTELFLRKVNNKPSVKFNVIVIILWKLTCSKTIRKILHNERGQLGSSFYVVCRLSGY